MFCKDEFIKKAVGGDANSSRVAQTNTCATKGIKEF